MSIKYTKIVSAVGFVMLSASVTPAHAWFFGPSKEEKRIEQLEKEKKELQQQVEQNRPTEVVVKPENSNVQLPAWFVKIPEPTDKHMFVPGVATSTSLNMAIQKAQTDADVKVAFHTQTSIQAMLKMYQVDTGQTVIEDTELAARRITDIFISGQQQKDIVVQREGRMYRVFVLMQYPVEPIVYFANQARKKFGIDDQKQRAFDEIKNHSNAQKPAEVTTGTPSNTGNNMTAVTPVPAQPAVQTFELKPANQVDTSTLPHNTIADQQLKSKIDEILKRPDAVVGTLTVR